VVEEEVEDGAPHAKQRAEKSTDRTGDLHRLVLVVVVLMLTRGREIAGRLLMDDGDGRVERRATLRTPKRGAGVLEAATRRLGSSRRILSGWASDHGFSSGEGGTRGAVEGEAKAVGCRLLSQTRMLPNPRPHPPRQVDALTSSCAGDACYAVPAKGDHPAAPSPAAADPPENDANALHAYDLPYSSACDCDPSHDPYSPAYFPHARPTNADSPHS